MANGRRSRKFIKSLISERGVTLSNIKIISEEIVNFFRKLYSKPEGASWRVESISRVLGCDQRGPHEGVSRVPHQWDNKSKYKCDLHCSGRLRKVLHETIFDFQGAFVEGRHILDAVLIANEVVDEKRRSCARKEGVQLEMEILDEGLFVFIKFCNPIDVLSRLMIRAEETGLTEGFFVGRDRTRVSLLQFVDDIIFFSKASLEHLQNLKIILLVFGQVSGLKINLEKSTISGLPLGGNPKTIGFWDPVVERILRRLDVSIALKIEKLQRDFLWFGVGKGKKDHLIRWDVVCRPKELGDLGFRKTSLRNIALLGKWLWRFPRERNGLWHKVITSIYGTHPNRWDANMVVRWSHRCPWKAIAQVFQDFSNEKRIRFWEDLWWGNQTLCSQFVGLYRVIYVKNLTVSNVLGNSFPLSWNFNFCRNISDTEIDLLQRIMSFLSLVLFSPSLVDLRAWSLSLSGLFSVKSFFLALSKVSNPILFLLAKFLWSSKAPSKVKDLAWLVVHGKVNTNDKLQLRRPYKSLCPQWCILCKGNGESIDHLFLHCPVTIGLWHKLFNLAGLAWVPPRGIVDMMVIAFKGLGNSLRGKTLWQIACLTLLWMVWQERNNRIFEDKGRTEEMLWDLLLFYSSLWASCTAAFSGVPLSVLQLNWAAVCVSKV
ncbi:putative ribonuclease H protein [Vitis vinifera]|uniref:Putative ribonuclease H protein n=1 Tax=Vitis vinifera TaxID=29760 RepID=A0A438ITJ9_VITVI|nr:putative ribonuclease H protein [Vitis vinifera]